MKYTLRVVSSPLQSKLFAYPVFAFMILGIFALKGNISMVHELLSYELNMKYNIIHS